MPPLQRSLLYRLARAAGDDGLRVEPPPEPDIQAGTDFEGGVSFEEGVSFENPPPTSEYSEEILQENSNEFIPPIASDEAAYDFSQTLDYTPEVPVGGTPDTADFSDVTDFANTNTVSGPLTYMVIIEGIESSRLLMQLKEAMMDSRFGWDVAELLTHVGGGRLILQGLSPAKASVLINRIKYLSFKISWRQDVLSGS